MTTDAVIAALMSVAAILALAFDIATARQPTWVSLALGAQAAFWGYFWVRESVRGDERLPPSWSDVAIAATMILVSLGAIVIIVAGMGPDWAVTVFAVDFVLWVRTWLREVAGE